MNLNKFLLWYADIHDPKVTPDITAYHCFKAGENRGYLLGAIVGTLLGIALAALIVRIELQNIQSTIQFHDSETHTVLGTWACRTGDTATAFVQWCAFNEYNPETLKGSVYATEN